MKAGVICAVATALASACTTTAASPAQDAFTAASVDERAQVEAATRAWDRAIVAKDVAALRHLMAPEFTLTGGDGSQPFPREAWLHNLGNMVLARYSTRVMDVRAYGQIAVARVEGEWDVTFSGRRSVEPFSLADFWVHRDGRWQVFRRHRIR
jgi:uncharacterized protein (TIGR02246 family)